MNQLEEGTLAIEVWPTYVGMGSTSPTTGLADEPFDADTYQRGQIAWQQVNGRIEGHARVFLPKGGYDHLVYANHPTSALGVLGAPVKLPHPFIAEEDGWLDIGPITNGDNAEKIV